MKKIKSFLKIFLTAALITQQARAQEPVTGEKEFTKISIPDHGKVILKQGDECSVRIEADDHHTGTANVSNGTLTINSDGSVIAYVTVKDLERIEISGNGKVETDGVVKSNNLELIISGIGNMDMNVEAGTIKTNIGGKGTIEIAGVTDELNVSISGAGKVVAGNLKAVRCNVNISGAGKCEVNAKDELNITISGVGTVNYVNEPAKITKNISGFGKTGLASKNESDSSEKEAAEKDRKVAGMDREAAERDRENAERDKERERGSHNRTRVEVKDEDGSTVVHYHRNKKIQAHWGGFELGFNTYGKTAFSSEIPAGYDFLELNTGNSIAVNLNLFDWSARILDYHLMFVTGLGITWNNWRFQSDRTLIANMPFVEAGFDSIDYSKNKLTASYVTLPLLLEYNSSANEKKTFHIGAGIIFGYRIGSHTKQVYEDNGKTRKIKTYDDFNLDPFRYDLTLRIGYRGYTIFASYGIGKLFKSNQGPELHPLTFGLTLLNW